MIVLPVNECKWSFKEGDVAVLSTSRPGAGMISDVEVFLLLNFISSKLHSCSQAVRGKRNHSLTAEDDEEAEVSGRVAGTIRRHFPVDTRDPPGAILHFYVGDSYDPSSRLFQKS